MSHEFRLPQISMGMQEAVINEWFKNVGDAVTEGDVLVEVEAEKGIVELESPATGVLTEICFQAGETAPVLSLLALIGEAATLVASTPVATPVAAPKAAAVQAPVAPEALRVPMQGLRATIARRMQESLQRAAQLTLTREVDVTDAVAGRNGVSVTDLIARACVLALAEHPHVNSWVEDDAIVVQPRVHLGCAVDLPSGLVVPVVRDADTLGLRDLGRARREVVDQVLDGRFSPDVVSGSTFTITNLGSEGIDAFTPILNLPEAAILGIGRARQVAVPADQGVAWRTMVVLSLTFDHRALDGAPAARFLGSVASRLESPAELIAENT